MACRKLICTLFYLSTIFQVNLADDACDKSKCKGPTAYYKDLKCSPIYGEDSCCPVKYNCDNLDGRSTSKCYYQGQVYEIGERVREADTSSPCSPCICTEGDLGTARFACAIIDCIGPPEGCYFKASFTECCGGGVVCPGNETEVAKCEVDGNTYLAGQRFAPESDPTKSCICDEGYTGKNEAPFCKTQNYAPCSVELYHSAEVSNNCAPVFHNDQNPSTDCNIAYRCQNKDDVVLPAEVPDNSGPAHFCEFGNLTMKIGDQLNQGTGYDSVCVKCVCEVPPVPTCQRLPNSECDVTVHKKFEDFLNESNNSVNTESFGNDVVENDFNQ